MKHHFILAAIAIAVSCTNYQEEEAPASFGTDVSELSFESDLSIQSVTVSSGTKWGITQIPSWLTLNSIKRSVESPYEWSVSFIADVNEGYDREGLVVFENGTSPTEVSVVQEGKKGQYVPVESVFLFQTALTLTEGESSALTYSIIPSNASVKNVYWESSSPSVASVSDAGKVKALTAGTSIITVTTEYGGKTASCAVTVKAKVIPVQSVSLDKTSITMTEGDTQTLIATVAPSNATDKSVTWSSSNTSVATVSSSGVVTAKAAGTATITVTTNDGGKKATCSVTVAPVAVTGVTLNKSSLSLYQNDSETLVATVLPSNASNKNVSWSTSNSSVATVTTNGQVTAISSGTATITVTTADGGKTASCEVSVTADPYGAVDLGLSVKWSSFNYGASSVTSIGGYYMWGDPNGTGEPFFFTPPSVNSISGTQYDIVRRNWGGSWRIPTRSEINELYSNCTWTTTTLNGVSVLKVTGRNGASIYLPFTGYGMPDDGPVGTVTVSDGNNAYMMSAESYGDSYGRFVYVFYFTPSGSRNTASYNASFIKFPIRPVR